jgi:hypothetical protein
MALLLNGEGLDRLLSIEMDAAKDVAQKNG